jgi:hypothetical protein
MYSSLKSPSCRWLRPQFTEIVTLYFYFDVIDYKIKYRNFNPTPVRASGTGSLGGDVCIDDKCDMGDGE